MTEANCRVRSGVGRRKRGKRSDAGKAQRDSGLLGNTTTEPHRRGRRLLWAEALRGAQAQAAGAWPADNRVRLTHPGVVTEGCNDRRRGKRRPTDTSPAGQLEYGRSLAMGRPSWFLAGSVITREQPRQRPRLVPPRGAESALLCSAHLLLFTGLPERISFCPFLSTELWPQICSRNIKSLEKKDRWRQSCPSLEGARSPGPSGLLFVLLLSLTS